MNKVLYSFLSLLMVATLLFTTSCGGDEEEVIDRPVIDITGIDDPSGASVMVGEEVAFDVNVTAPGGFNVLRINKTVGNGTPVLYEEVARPAGQTMTEYLYDFAYTPLESEAGETVVFDFIAVDDAGMENTRPFTLTVLEPELVAYADELLFAPLGDGSSETWYNAITGETYSSDEVNGSTQPLSAGIDFGYYYGNTDFASLAAPASFPIAAGQSTWNKRNITKLKKTGLPATAFIEANSIAAVEDIYTSASFGTNEGVVTNLQEGDVIAFMTDPTKTGGSKKGLLHVTEIVTGSGTTGKIMFNVKIIP